MATAEHTTSPDNVIRFPQSMSPEAAEALHGLEQGAVALEVYREGRFAGLVQDRQGTVQAYSAAFACLGAFKSIDAATRAVVRSLAH